MTEDYYKDPYGEQGQEQDSYSTRLNLRQHFYWWVWGESQGRRVALGPYNDEDEAREKGKILIGGYFDAVELPTRDIAKATQMLKARLLGETHNMPYSLEKVKHKL